MRQTQRALWALLCVIATNGCLIDEPCDAHQTKAEGVTASCVCDPGYVIGPEGYGCIKCGKNEEAKSNECVCKEGFSRPTPTADCQAFAAGDLGTKCEADGECGEAAPFCAVSEEPAYCTTRGCQRASDCEEGWRCSMGAEPFCQKAPAGLGTTCKASSDCSDPEAAYCEAFMSYTCMINDCAKNPSKCLRGTVCCDLSGLIGTSLCVPPSTLADGKCFGGTDPVIP